MSGLSVRVYIGYQPYLNGLEFYEKALADLTGIHTSMAAAVEKEVADHLRGLNSRSPNTSFYGRASRSTEVTADGSEAVVSITQRGIALRYYGGRVLPKNVKNLAIPTEHVPLAGTEGRKAPREVGLLAYLPKRNLDVSATTGYLVEGEEKLITRGPRKGKTRIVPKKGGKMMYVLRAWTDHNADASVLPALVNLQQAAAAAGRDYIESFLDEGGAP